MRRFNGARGVAVGSGTLEWSSQYASWTHELRIIRVPRSGNPNLHAQAGIATLITDRTDTPLEEIIRVEYEALNSNEFTRYKDEERERRVGLLSKLTLPSSEAKALLQHVSRLGLTRLALFPGYANVVESLKDEALL
jgi:hypothetical protein